MAEVDGWLARARADIVRLQDDRRQGLGDVSAVARLVPICAELLRFCSEFAGDVLARLPRDRG